MKMSRVAEFLSSKSAGHAVARLGRDATELPRVAMFSGYGGAGKDAAADLLVKKYGYKRLAFSDTIQDRMLKENPTIGGKTASEHIGGGSIDEWGAAKKTVPGFRDYMIGIGNDMKKDNPNALFDITAAKIEADPGSRYVVTGPRTPNEMKLAERFNGATVRVSRPGVGPAISDSTGLPDPSETALNEYAFDHRIANTGSLSDLHGAVERQIRRPRRRAVAPIPITSHRPALSRIVDHRMV